MTPLREDLGQSELAQGQAGLFPFPEAGQLKTRAIRGAGWKLAGRESSAAVGATEVLRGSVTSVFRAVARTKLEFRTELFVTAGLLASFVIGVRWGIVGVCVARTAWVAVVTPVVMTVALGLVDSDLRDVFRCISGPAVAAGVMGLSLLSLHLVRPSIPLLVSDGLFFVSAALIGIASYTLALLWRAPRDVRWVLRSVRQAFTAERI